MEIFKSKYLLSDGTLKDIIVTVDDDIGFSAVYKNTGKLALCGSIHNNNYEEMLKSLRGSGFVHGSIQTNHYHAGIPATTCPFYQEEPNLQKEAIHERQIKTTKS